MNRRTMLYAVCAALVFAWLPQGHAKKTKDTDGVEQKIRLMGEVYLARDRGDFETAQRLLDQLLQQGPQDLSLVQLKKTLREQADRQEKALQAAAASASAAVPVSVALEKREGVVQEVPPAETSHSAVTGVPQTTLLVTPTAKEVAKSRTDAWEPPLASQEAIKAGTLDVESLMKLETTRQQGLLAASQARLAHSQQLANEGRHAEALAELNGVADRLPFNPMTQSVHQQVAALRIDLEHRLAVADLTPGAEPPRLSMNQDPVTQQAARMEVELQLIELPVEVVDDLWKAWVFFAEQTIQGQKDRMVLDSKGRQVFLRQANRIPTQRQQLFIWAFQSAKAKPGSGAPLRIREGVSGLVAELNPEPIIKALSGLEGCRVLGSPRFTAVSGQKTLLGFTPEVEARANLMEGPRRVAETRIGWQVEIRPELRHGDRSVSFEVGPKVNRYEGFVVSAEGFSMPVDGATGPSQSVHSSHELRTVVETPLGATLMLAGLTWDEGAPHRLKTGVLRQLPLVGHYVQLKETAGRQTELLLFVRARKP